MISTEEYSGCFRQVESQKEEEEEVRQVESLRVLATVLLSGGAVLRNWCYLTTAVTEIELWGGNHNNKKRKRLKS